MLALTWAGTRGVITLAAAFSLPTTIPARDLLLFCAYLVVLVTLVGQGLTFAAVLRRLHLPGTEVAQAISAEREELLAWRDSGQLPDADLRVLERELDHEESLLPG